MSESADHLPKLEIDTQRLIADVEYLLNEARKRVAEENFGPVNWGQLGVSDVEYRISLRPPATPHVVVIVEEAAPECRLTEWLNDRLDRERFPHVRIECEW